MLLLVLPLAMAAMRFPAESRLSLQPRSICNWHSERGDVRSSPHLGMNMAPLAVAQPSRLTAQIKEAKSLKKLLQIYSDQGQHLNEIHVSALWTALNRLSTGRLAYDERVELLIRQTVAMAAKGRLGARAVSNIAYGAARCGLTSRSITQLFVALGAATVCKVDDFNPQALANTAWAFAKTGHYDKSVFDALDRAATSRIGEFRAQALANTVWAFATIGHAAPELFTIIAAEAQGRLSEFTSQNLANTAWYVPWPHRWHCCRAFSGALVPLHSCQHTCQTRRL